MRRVAALVNVTMSPEEVAEKLGITEAALVQFGNGYAQIVDTEKSPTSDVSTDPADNTLVFDDGEVWDIDAWEAMFEEE